MSEHNERTEARRRDKNKKKQQQQQGKSAATKFPQLKRPYLPEIASYQVEKLQHCAISYPQLRRPTLYRAHLSCGIASVAGQISSTKFPQLKRPYLQRSPHIRYPVDKKNCGIAPPSSLYPYRARLILVKKIAALCLKLDK